MHKNYCQNTAVMHLRLCKHLKHDVLRELQNREWPNLKPNSQDFHKTKPQKPFKDSLFSKICDWTEEEKGKLWENSNRSISNNVFSTVCLSELPTTWYKDKNNSKCKNIKELAWKYDRCGNETQKANTKGWHLHKPQVLLLLLLMRKKNNNINLNYTGIHPNLSICGSQISHKLTLLASKLKTWTIHQMNTNHSLWKDPIRIFNLWSFFCKTYL